MSNFITRPKTNPELYQSFRNTLHGLVGQGVRWEDFYKLEQAYDRKTKTPGSFLGHAIREPLTIKRSEALSYDIYLEWLDWYKPLEDGSYDRAAYPRATPKAATILSAKSYDATMVELIYNFEAKKFEVWFNIQEASTTTSRHMKNFMSAVGYGSRMKYVAEIGGVEVPIYRFSMGEYEDNLSSRSRYSDDIVGQMDTAMNSWRKALKRTIKRNTRHSSVGRWVKQARDFATLARRNMTLDLEEQLARQRMISPHTQVGAKWIQAVDKTYDEEAFYNMVLEYPEAEYKRMLNVFRELDA
jgi:hypothetical protein